MPNNTISYLIFALIILFTIKNFMQLKRLTHERKFTEAYAKVLRDDDDALDAMRQYVEAEKNLEYKNEAYIVIAYEEIRKGIDPYKTIEMIDFDAILTNKKGFSYKMLNNHTDLFVWLDLLIAEARNKSMLDIIEAVYNKMLKYDDNLNNHLEYVEFKTCADILLEKRSGEEDFLQKILAGDYATMAHDKRLIGLYKRIAASYLAYAGESFDEFFENDLHSFACTSVGKHLMDSLNIFEKYPPKTEEVKEEETNNTEEVKEEENKEEK